MRIAVDVSPLSKGRFLQNRVRGTGNYIKNLKKSLINYCPQHEYIFFTRGENLPNDIDLIHYPYFEPFFLTQPLFNKHKFVVTVHDLAPLVFPDKFPIGMKGRVKWELQRISLLRSSQIITDSISSKKDIERITGANEEIINVVYLASDEDFKKEDISENTALLIRKKYNLPNKFALYVGDVTWNKNLPNLISSISNTNVVLVMIGKALADKNFDPENQWNFDQVKVQKLSAGNKNIILLGFVEKDDLIKIYNLATVFVMPSFYEGFGLPILEAASCGCPIITAKTGSVPEVIGNAAFYVDPNDTEDMGKIIRKLYFDSNLQKQFSNKALKQANKFSWKKTAENTTKVYEKVFTKK